MLLQFRRRKPGFEEFEPGGALAQAIVDTVREPLLVLDQSLCVVAASRSFYLTFGARPQDTQGRPLFSLGDGQWDIPQLRAALESIASSQKTIEAFEVERFFPAIGRRVMMLNARAIYRPHGGIQQILLAIDDATDRVALERANLAAHDRIALLMQESTHRVKNSLQSMASMVRIEGHGQKSDEGKAALERVSDRIGALGLLYAKLSNSGTVEAVSATTYLEDLCRDLVASAQSEDATFVLETDIENELLPTDQAIPIGLIVNELVTNVLKYAFPSETKGTVIVTLKRTAGELRLTVADNGSGIDMKRVDSGLGGRLVEGFAHQLGGKVERESGDQGTIVHVILPGKEPVQTQLRDVHRV
jgi:two-component sensor histidine kinase